MKFFNESSMMCEYPEQAGGEFGGNPSISRGRNRRVFGPGVFNGYGGIQRFPQWLAAPDASSRDKPARPVHNAAMGSFRRN
jgi:hypothetical protein